MSEWGRGRSDPPFGSIAVKPDYCLTIVDLEDEASTARGLFTARGCTVLRSRRERRTSISPARKQSE
jgi:hypothetical protein